MAEIKIEKKRPVWPWIILIIVILGILAYVFLYTDTFNEDTDNTDDIEELNDNRTMHNNRDKQISFSVAQSLIS
ncbi:MAG: hypothetical protein ACQEWD_11830 [Bacteroidota bacterium]|uniref:Uncharacterized protein n=1 Tax=Salegentibacter flavus TaxID=287099 RepID=A0A1I4YNI8_9FLAO|nr:hypothetical protein [Salegentibacter flavus]SFN39363.1 hypothetical protein SAMN05660413_00865 [Salegentibacter flavus]